MEPHRSFGNRQHLLPYEQQICDAIGISKEEYFDYFALVQQYKKERPQEYTRVPHVVNGPVTAVVVNLVVGVLLTAAAVLLAPNQKHPKSRSAVPTLMGRTFEAAPDTHRSPTLMQSRILQSSVHQSL